MTVDKQGSSEFAAVHRDSFHAKTGDFEKLRFFGGCKQNIQVGATKSNRSQRLLGNGDFHLDGCGVRIDFHDFSLTVNRHVEEAILVDCHAVWDGISGRFGARLEEVDENTFVGCKSLFSL